MQLDKLKATHNFEVLNKMKEISDLKAKGILKEEKLQGQLKDAKEQDKAAQYLHKLFLDEAI